MDTERRWEDVNAQPLPPQGEKCCGEHESGLPVCPHKHWLHDENDPVCICNCLQCGHKESSVTEEWSQHGRGIACGENCLQHPKETPVEGWEAQYDRIYENGTGAEMKEFVRHLAEERQRGREEEKEHILGLVLSILGEYDGFEIGQTREKIRKLAAKSPREGAEGP